MSAQMTVEQWEAKLVTELADLLECEETDAQTFLDSQVFHYAQAYCQGLTPPAAALYIFDKITIKPIFYESI